MQNTKYLAAVLFGILAGWFSQSWLVGVPITDSAHKAANTLSSTESDIVTDTTPLLIPTTTETAPDLGGSTVLAEINPARFIENLSLMSSKEFSQYLNSIGNDNATVSKQLLIGVLNELLTITDSKTRYRIIDFLRSSRNLDREKREFVVEDWVMEKIRNVDQQAQWLEVVSHMGLWTKANIEFLANNLDSFHDSESRVSAMLALSQSIDLDRRLDPDLRGQSAGGAVADKVALFLDSDLDLERAAAVSTLKSFPSSDFSERIATALDDTSERVRISAILALQGGKRGNEAAIKNRLIERMQSQDASDFERLQAWHTLGSFSLEGEAYAAVYDFGAHDQERLSERYRRKGPNQRSQWGY